MIEYWIIAGLIAGCWGIVWACVLQFTSWGRWAALRRTWLTVVIGTAGTLASALVVVDLMTMAGIVGLFGLSSLGIIVRSLYNEMHEDL